MIWLWAALACGGTGPAETPSGGEGAVPEAHHGDHATATHRFEDAEKWAAVFDDPERDGWQKPDAVVAAMGVRPGQVVADLGAGTGYLVPHLRRAVGDTGRVIAVEVEASLVAHMKERFSGVAGVEIRQTGVDAPGLQRGEADHIVLLDVYHHISSRVAYFTALQRAMSPGGRLTIVDFDPAVEVVHGPPAEHRIPLATVAAELANAGWVSVGAIDEPLEEQYIGQFGPARSDADVDWLASRIDDGGVQLIDVRTPGEYASGHVPGARSVPLDQLGAPVAGVDKSRPVVLVCQSGGRSSRAADLLAEAGYQAINIMGGTSAWAQSGHPIEQ